MKKGGKARMSLEREKIINNKEIETQKYCEYNIKQRKD